MNPIHAQLWLLLVYNLTC